MTKERNERFTKICQLAREMWEKEGRPMDRRNGFWSAAMNEIDAGEATSHDREIVPAEVPVLSRAIAAMDGIAAQPGGAATVQENKNA